MKDRESAIESYKKKIVALEFKEEDAKKKVDVLALRISELEAELR